MRERTVLLAMFLTLGTVIWFSETFARGADLIIALVLLAIAHGTYMAASQHRRRHLARPEAPGFRPFVSIVIPAKNERAVIAGTVTALMGLDYKGPDGSPGYEVLVVDDSSTDGTGEALSELVRRHPNCLRVHRRTGGYPSKAGVLNEAMPLTHGEVIAVLDADAQVAPDFLTAIVPYLADPRVGAVQACKHISNAGECWLTQAQDDELAADRTVQRNRDLVGGAVELRGNGMLLKRTALDAVGGWSEGALTEDLDMSSKLVLAGWEIRFAYDVAILEEAIPHMSALIRQRRRWAEGALRRHMDYFYVFGMPGVSLAKKLDIGVYFLQLAFPIWIAEDLLYQAWEVLHGQPPHLTVVLYIVLGSGVLLGLHQFNALRTELGFGKPLQLLKRTFVTLVYLYHWIPVFMYVVAKVMVRTKPGKWGKTEHSGLQLTIPQEGGIGVPPR